MNILSWTKTGNSYYRYYRCLFRTFFFHASLLSSSSSSSWKILRKQPFFYRYLRITMDTIFFLGKFLVAPERKTSILFSICVWSILIVISLTWPCNGIHHLCPYMNATWYISLPNRCNLSWITNWIKNNNNKPGSFFFVTLKCFSLQTFFLSPKKTVHSPVCRVFLACLFVQFIFIKTQVIWNEKQQKMMKKKISTTKENGWPPTLIWSSVFLFFECPKCSSSSSSDPQATTTKPSVDVCHSFCHSSFSPFLFIYRWKYTLDQSIDRSIND